jgi:hypothetical protein
MRGVAINVGANTNEPGFRGPIDADGRFTYVPIPESEPTTEPVPTYGDVADGLDAAVPETVHDRPVHLDPEFAGYPCCERYTYGDEHGVKAGPLSELSAGEYLFFYATLSVVESAGWLPPEWGAFLIGQFRLARDPVTGEEFRESGDDLRAFANNAHAKRDPFDALVLVEGDPTESGLYERAVPLSQPEDGTEAGDLVTDYSADSGRGPWWRRPLRFDAAGARAIRDRTGDVGRSG